MFSLKNAIETALSRKEVPSFTGGSMHSLAQQLGMSFPASIQNLSGILQGLPNASITFDSGNIVGGNVHGSSQLFLQSDGACAFIGRAHESGAIGDNFFLAVVLLDVKDASGQSFTLSHDDTLAGQLEIGFNEKNWHDYGSHELIRDNWESVKASGVQFRLHASKDPFQVVEIAVSAFFVALGIAAGVVRLSRFCSDQGSEWQCGLVPSGDPNGPMNPGDPAQVPDGMKFRCRCEFN
jgi:hypothetical protein